MSEIATIEAMLKLLEDPDEEIFSMVKQKLFDEGLSVMKRLEAELEQTNSPLIHKRIVNIAHHINRSNIANELRHWANTEKQDIIDASFLIALYQYPDLDLPSHTLILNQIIADIREELHDDNTPLEKITLLNHIFFQAHKITRTFSTATSIQNFFINILLQTKKGNFFSLALLYAGIGQRLGLPLMGIMLPENFALAYIDINFSSKDDNTFPALFYINPANKGAVFGRYEIDSFLSKLNINPQNSYYTPISNLEVIHLFLDYLIIANNKVGNNDIVDDLKMFQKVIRGE